MHTCMHAMHSCMHACPSLLTSTESMLKRWPASGSSSPACAESAGDPSAQMTPLHPGPTTRHWCRQSNTCVCVCVQHGSDRKSAGSSNGESKEETNKSRHPQHAACRTQRNAPRAPCPPRPPPPCPSACARWKSRPWRPCAARGAPARGSPWSCGSPAPRRRRPSTRTRSGRRRGRWDVFR